ncbi:uncharacterized protein EAE98_004702 [Botrytis deweyae]|uniref:Arf-GAP domain-containing protein n=1 Tax=Botrytis deweyae TaxID=2478750 RepID=A0ABQ7IP22_9HELO|nr:uncharacterized protein EAE98_004702 [Botrytis deweyae]KAF7930301.1 hypothetical protein EAE98_004702 [Botrytis deweyae]
MSPSLFSFGSDKRIDNWIEEKELEKYDLKKYENPQKMRVSKESDAKDVVRRMYRYKHKEDKSKDLYVLVPGHKKEKSPGLLGGGVTEHTITRTTKTSDGRGKNLNLPININLGKQNITIKVEDGERSRRRGDGEKERHRHRGDSEKERHRHHRRRGSGETHDDSKDDEDFSRDRRERRRRRSRDRSRDGADSKGRGTDGKAREYSRSMRQEEDSESDDSSYTDNESKRNANDDLQSNYSGKVSSRGHSARPPTIHLPFKKESRTKERSEIQSIIEDGSIASSHRPPIDIQPPPRAQSIRKDGPVRSSRRPPPDIQPLPRAQSIIEDGSVRSFQTSSSKSKHSSRAPSAAGQSRLSQNTDTLLPSLDKLIEENKDVLDGKTSQDGRNSTSSQHLKPNSREDYKANSDRRRAERGNSGLSSKNVP